MIPSATVSVGVFIPNPSVYPGLVTFPVLGGTQGAASRRKPGVFRLEHVGPRTIVIDALQSRPFEERRGHTVAIARHGHGDHVSHDRDGVDYVAECPESRSPSRERIQHRVRTH